MLDVFTQADRQSMPTLRLLRLILEVGLATTTAGSNVRLAFVIAVITLDSFSAAVFPELSDLSKIVFGRRFHHDSPNVDERTTWNFDMKFNRPIQSTGNIMALSLVNETGQGLHMITDWQAYLARG